MIITITIIIITIFVTTNLPPLSAIVKSRKIFHIDQRCIKLSSKVAESFRF